MVQRRVDLLEAEGVRFITNINIGKDMPARLLTQENDAVLFAMGASSPRNLPVDGRDLDGIHYAMEFLEVFLHDSIPMLYVNDKQANQKRQAGHDVGALAEKMSAKGRNVIVIGGGDTATDCIGTSLRSVRNERSAISLIVNIATGRQVGDRFRDHAGAVTEAR